MAAASPAAGGLPDARPAGPALARCIGIPLEEFAAEYWGRTPLLSPAADLGRRTSKSFDDLITVADVDDLVSRRGLRTPFLRMVRDGRVLEPRVYAGPGGAGAQVGDQALDERVLRAFLDGATLVLQGLHRVWGPVGDFARQLTDDLGHPVGANAYLTPPGQQGFGTHYDTHDVFVLQIAGPKRWRVYPPVITDPLPTQPWDGRTEEVGTAADADPVLDVVLEPGDALYLPRGWSHAAEARGQLSMHLTVGVFPVTRYTLVEALLALAAQQAPLRRSLPIGVDATDPAAVADELRHTAEELTEWLVRVDPAAVADQLRPRVWQQSRPEPVGPLAMAAAAGSVTSGTRIAPRAHLRWRLVPSGLDEVSLQVFDRTVRLPARYADAVRAVLTGTTDRVSRLPNLDEAERLALARRLLEEAVVVPVDP